MGASASQCPIPSVTFIIDSNHMSKLILRENFAFSVFIWTDKFEHFLEWTIRFSGNRVSFVLILRILIFRILVNPAEFAFSKQQKQKMSGMLTPKAIPVRASKKKFASKLLNILFPFKHS